MTATPGGYPAAIAALLDGILGGRTDPGKIGGQMKGGGIALLEQHGLEEFCRRLRLYCERERAKDGCATMRLGDPFGPFPPGSRDRVRGT